MSENASPAKTRIILLGTGTPNVDPERSGPCVAVLRGETAYLVDFGPGVVRRAAAAALGGIDALDPPRITRAFLTHLHSDHTAGYADLILTPWVLGRRRALEVHGPAGTQRLTDHLLQAYDRDIQERVEGLEQANPTGWRVAVHEISTNPVYEGEGLTVEAFPVQHGSWPAFGFRFRAQDRTIVISGDTTPTEPLLEMSAGCDILVHEVYSADRLSEQPAAWHRYHTRMHTSSTELARIATAVRPKLLVLYHQLFWGASEEELLAEVKRGYDGAVVSGHDLDVF